MLLRMVVDLLEETLRTWAVAGSVLTWTTTVERVIRVKVSDGTKARATTFRHMVQSTMATDSKHTDSPTTGNHSPDQSKDIKTATARTSSIWQHNILGKVTLSATMSSSHQSWDRSLPLSCWQWLRKSRVLRSRDSPCLSSLVMNPTQLLVESIGGTWVLSVGKN